MAWVKLDDQFFRHPKAIEAGRDGRDLYLAGLCYCGSALTDGAIPGRALRILAADAEVDDPKGAAERLIEVGLWAKTATGFEVHDYHDYNPTKERVVATREARAEAGSKGGKQRSANLLGTGLDGAIDGAQAKSNPVPVPRPVPVEIPVNDQTDGAPSERADGTAPPPPSEPVDPSESVDGTLPPVPAPPPNIATMRTAKQIASDRRHERRDALFRAWCRGIGLDPDSAEADVGKTIAANHLKSVVDKPAPTPEDFERCTRYMTAEPWRDEPPKVAQVVAGYAGWVARGRPEEPVERSPPSRRAGSDDDPMAYFTAVARGER